MRTLHICSSKAMQRSQFRLRILSAKAEVFDPFIDAKACQNKGEVKASHACIEIMETQKG